jgi:hypothetical protein
MGDDVPVTARGITPSLPMALSLLICGDIIKKKEPVSIILWKALKNYFTLS